MSVNYKTTGENLGLCELNNMAFSEACTNSARNDEFNYLQILNRVRNIHHILYTADSIKIKLRNCFFSKYRYVFCRESFICLRYSYKAKDSLRYSLGPLDVPLSK